ncbi:MAG: putative Ig domain-containing protein [Burkholderiales bacterium]|nr:putative Ig domain-containing protein [Opitutaceae bacterium]
MPALLFRTFARRFLALASPCVAALALPAALVAADLTIWPGQFTIRPWESARLTAADVVGPDGIVYPDFTGVGVTGGIPDVNDPAVRATYTVFNVTTYGAMGNGVADDDVAVAAAAAAARAHANGVNKSILYFPAGTYLLSNPIEYSQNNVVIDGDGPASTILKIVTDTSVPLSQAKALLSFKKLPVYSGYMIATAKVNRGDNTATFDLNPATNGYTVGSWARLGATVFGAGTTMSDRFNNPDNHVIYADIYGQHTGRAFIAKVTAVNSAAKTVTFDRTFTHDFFVDESPQLRNHALLENCGIQDLTIDTLAATATVDPFRFENAANSWAKNIKTIKARDWPYILLGVTRFEVRDSQFLGTWTPINNGGTSYFGWISSTDSLMDNCQASDLRHMAIFQYANRSVIRSCTFSGKTVQSPQLHGRFPHENLVEGTTFAHTGGDGVSTRGITAYASDGAASLRHGVEGPRNVFYNNRTDTGMGTAKIGGLKEGLIFVYNRVLKTDDAEAQPSFHIADRSFDGIIRGNVFQSITSMPFMSLEDPTCPGWSVTDNKIYGSNGYLFEGDSAPATTFNNRFFPAATTPDATTSPEVASIYAWQRTNAATARLVLVIDNRNVTDTGGTTSATVVRVKADTTSALTVNLSATPAGLSFPASVSIPAGQTSVTFTLTGTAVSGGEKIVTVTAAASGLLGDTETVNVLDQNIAQPNFGAYKWPVAAAGLPPGWKASNFGQVTAPGSQTYSAVTDTWQISGGGWAATTDHGSLARSGRRFMYKTVDGDGEIRARITSATSENQVGLMITDDEASMTEFIWVEPTGRVLFSGNGGQPHNAVVSLVPAGTKVVPQWLRLKRTGFVFTVSKSTLTNPASEADWTTLVTVDMYQDPLVEPFDYKSPAVLDQRMHFGLFINSGAPNLTASASFTGVYITGDPLASIPVIVPGQTASGPINLPFNYELAAAYAPTSFALAAGSTPLPPGLSLNAATGIVSGTPTTMGVYTPTFVASNALGSSDPVSVEFTVTATPLGSLIMYEGFNYSVGLNSPDPDGGLNSGNGLPATNPNGIPSGTSTGLRGSWGTLLDVAAGLTYAQGDRTLAVVGGSGAPNNATWGNGMSAYRNMSSDPHVALRVGGNAGNNFGIDGGTLYLSLLARTSSATPQAWRFALNGSGRNVFLENTATGWSLNENAAGPVATTGALTLNSTTLLVVRIDFVAGAGDTLRLWVNPPLDQTLGTANATRVTSVDFGNMASFTARPAVLGAMVFDEFRLGTTYAAVAPYTVPPPASALATFRSTYGLASDGSQDLLEPAGDGVKSLLKYAFNMLGTGTGQVPFINQPNATLLAPAGSAGLPFVSLSPAPDAALQLTYLRRKAAASPAPGITYAVQFSNDLGITDPWAVNPSASAQVVSLDATFERVTVTDSSPGSAKRFVRVHVTTE